MVNCQLIHPIYKDHIMEKIPHVTDTELRVMLFLRKPSTAQEIAEAFGIEKDSAMVYMSRMIDKGLVEKTLSGNVSTGKNGNGRIYSLSEMAQGLIKSGYFNNQINRLKNAGLIIG